MGPHTINRPLDNPKITARVNAWARYESLKQQLTANASTAAEYEAAYRQAAKSAGV